MPTATNVVEIVIQGTVPTTGSGTKNIYNVFHYQYSAGGGGPASAQAVGNAFVAAVWAAIAAQLSVAYTGVACLARYLDDATQQFVTCNVPASGALAGARLPTTSTVVFLLRSNTRGKNYRGSKKFGPIQEAQQLNDELTVAGATAWTTVGTNLPISITAVGGAVYLPCVLSRSLSQLRKNPTQIQTSLVNSALLNKTLGTLRRRKEKTVR